MTRDELLYKICPTDTTFDCRTGYKSCNCDNCNRVLNKWLDEYDKHVMTEVVDDFANWLVEQGILGSRCISEGEITDYGKVYAKKYKEQLKEQKK